MTRHNTKKFPESVLQQLFFRESVAGYEIVRVGDLFSEFKSECCEFVFKELETQTLFKTYVQRWGEYHSDIQYVFDTLCDEVEAKQVMITSYVPVEYDE